MKMEFIVIKRRVFTDADAETFTKELSDATGRGFRLDSSGANGLDLFAILSRPATVEERTAGTLSPVEKELVQALADCDMNVSNTAAELHVNRGTVQSRIERLYTRTGLNPLNFYDLNELLYMEVEER